MGTRVLIRGSAVAALVQEPTHSSQIAVPPVPVVACINVSSTVAPRPGRLLALGVCASVGHVALPFAVIACCRGEALVLRQMVYGQPSMFCAPFSSALCPRTLSLGGH